MSRERLILLAPIAPATSGNGLAMRCELFRRGATTRFETGTVVVPVAGAMPEGTDPAAADVIVEPNPDRARAGLARLIGSRVWRQRLTAAGELPRPARPASPGLAEAVAEAVVERLPGDIAAVHVMRSYLAPLGVALAERLGVARLTLDLDEDDAAFAASVGDVRGARAYTRLLDAFGDRFDGVSASAGQDARALALRHRLRVGHVPNAVELPAAPIRRPPPGLPPEVSLLFVGNLSYWPNVEAAQRLARVVLPAVRRQLGRSVRLRLVGPYDAQIADLAGPDVEVTGFVSDLATVYAAADVVVVPLRFGAGTRIKLLEAFAHGVPVAASPVAAAGLELSHRRHLLIAEDAEQIAAAVAAIVSDSRLADRLTAQAETLVRERYCTAAVTPIIDRFLEQRRSCAGAALQEAGSL